MKSPKLVAGIVIAGGRSTRMGGGDKCLMPLDGKPVLAHIIERLESQVTAIAINANGDPSRFRSFGVPVIPNAVAEHAGPLAGILAGLEWARTIVPEIDYIVTVTSDMPFLPDNLAARFLDALKDTERNACVARSVGGVRRLIGMWPTTMAASLEEALCNGVRKAGTWLDQQEPGEVYFPLVRVKGRPVDPFFNINRPEDLAAAEVLVGGDLPAAASPRRFSWLHRLAIWRP